MVKDIFTRWRFVVTGSHLLTYVKHGQHIRCHLGSFADKSQPAPTTSAAADSVDSSEMSEVDWNAIKRQRPTGSALFCENEVFTAVTHPDPILDWPALESSVSGRQLTDLSSVTDWKMMASKENECHQLKKHIGQLEKELKTAKDKTDWSALTEECRQEIRVLRKEVSERKAKLRGLQRVFEKQYLQLPNFLHSSCPTDNSNRLLRSLQSKQAKQRIRWSHVENDLHQTLIGTYFTGKLAELEQQHLTRARWFYQKHANRLHGNVQAVKLSDLVRGPAVEASAWHPMDLALRLQPSRSDLRLVPLQKHQGTALPSEIAKNSTQKNDPSQGPESVWLINPHTSSYLVGSASLPAFTAYLMLNQLKPRDSSIWPLQLITQGSEYHHKIADSNGNTSGISSSTTSDSPMNNPWHPFEQRKLVSLLEISADSLECETGFHENVEQLSAFWSSTYPSWPMNQLLLSHLSMPNYQIARGRLLLSSCSDRSMNCARICTTLFVCHPGASYVSRLVYTPANRLHACEMLRVSLLLDFSAKAKPIQLASVSMLGDWVSRRVSVTLGQETATATLAHYAFMVYVKALDTTSLFTAFHEMGFMNHHPPLGSVN